jgi:flagellar basal-body rod modification protein FlgD
VSNPVSGIGGNALYNWNMTSNTGNRPAVTAGGQTFAQIAAGLGIVPQTFDAGGTAGGTSGGTDPIGGTDPNGGSGSLGSTGSAPGTTGSGQTGTPAAVSGSTSGAPSGVGSTTGVGTGAGGATVPSPATSGDASGTGPASGVGATGSTGGTGSTGSGTIADLSGTDTFLKLLVAQLKNQDPTSPMDDQAFVTELAQFNTVEQMINLKQSMDTQTTSQQASEGIGLLGRTISYATTAVGSNNTVTSQGLVTGVSLAGGQVELQVGTQQVALRNVTAVSP